MIVRYVVDAGAGGREKETYSVVGVLLVPVVLGGAVGSFLRGGDICSSSARVDQVVVVFGKVRTTLGGDWDVTKADAVWLLRRVIVDVMAKSDGVFVLFGHKVASLVGQSV